MKTLKELTLEGVAEYFNVLLREAGCKSSWTLDEDQTSNSFGTWFCLNKGGVSDEQTMRAYTHEILVLKTRHPNCGDL